MFLVNRSCNQGEHVSIFSSLRLHLSPPLLAQFVVVLGKCILCEMSFEKREETFNLWVNNCLWSSLVKNTEEVCRVRRSPGGWWYVPEIKSLPVSQSLAVHSAWPKWNEKVPAPHWPDPRRSTPSTRLLEEEVGWGERDKLIEMENKRWKLPIDYHSLYTDCGPYFVSLMCPFNKSFCKLPWLCPLSTHNMRNLLSPSFCSALLQSHICMDSRHLQMRAIRSSSRIRTHTRRPQEVVYCWSIIILCFLWFGTFLSWFN